MRNYDLFIKSLDNQRISIEEEHNLYNNWIQFSNNESRVYEYRFSNYINKEYYIKFMNELFSIVNYLQKNFNNIFRFYFNNSFNDLFNGLEERYKKLLKNINFFTPLDLYKFDFLSLQYKRFQKKIKNFKEKEKELYFLLFYNENFENINYYDIRYLIYNFLK